MENAEAFYDGFWGTLFTHKDLQKHYAPHLHFLGLKTTCPLVTKGNFT